LINLIFDGKSSENQRNKRTSNRGYQQAP
jgi:hypothetical protein